MQQMTKHRPLAELDLLDDFLFNALLAYPEYGRILFLSHREPGSTMRSSTVGV